MSERKPLNTDWLKQATKQGRERAGAKAAEHLGGMTPEQIARMEQIAAKLPPGQFQKILAGSFARLDPATLGKVADKLSANGAKPPAEKRTDPTTLAVLAATAMRGRAGGVAGLLMILAGSAIANRTQPGDAAQPPSAASSTLRSVGKSVASALGNLAGKAADAGSRSSSPRIRNGVAQVQDIAALARSPLARQVMDQLGPALLRANKGAKPQ